MTTRTPPRPRPDILAIPTYGKGRPSGAPVRYRLSSNESPFPPSPALVKALRTDVEPHRYPPLEPGVLVADLARRLVVEKDRIWVSGGSIAVLEQLIRAYAGSGDEVVFSWRSYEAYPIIVRGAGAAVVEVPLDGSDQDVDALLGAITGRTKVVILCNPNNPTGTAIAESQLRRFLAGVPASCLVILDEAYREFVPDGVSADGIELQRDYANVAVLRTFSKAYGLAGVRVGYALAAPAIIDAARRLTLPFTVSAQAQRAACAALSTPDLVSAQIAVITGERDRLIQGLRAFGYPVATSAANFVWLPVGDAADELTRQFGAAGIAVRNFSGEGVRITVGMPEATDAVLSAAEPAVAEVRGRAGAAAAASV